MSLINDMLRDLDERKSPYSPRAGTAEGVRVAPASHQADKHFARYWGWGIALIVLVLIAVLAWHFYGKLGVRLLPAPEAVVDVSPVPTTTNVEQRVVDATDAGTSSYADILTVDVEPILGGIRFEISLSKPVQHRILRHGQQLIVDLPASRLLTALPNLTRYPMISTVEVQSHAAGTQLEVVVSEPFKLQATMLQQPTPRLLLELVSEQAETEALAEKGSTESAQPIAPSAASEGAELQEALPPPVFEKTSRTLTLAERDRQTNRRALKLIQQGRLKTARQLLENLLSELPAAHDSRATLIALLLSQEAKGAAQMQLSEALALAPEHLAFIKLKARLLLSQQQTREALVLLDDYKMQGDQELLALLAGAKQRHGEHAEAVVLYRRLLEQNNRQPQWWVGLAISLEAIEQRIAALQAYRQAQQLPGISPSLAQYAAGRINQLQ